MLFGGVVAAIVYDLLFVDDCCLWFVVRCLLFVFAVVSCVMLLPV